ncbi:MAG TPA: penicillin acylase family protein [Vicinamibacterales bacterium]|nr:penicillin acylase family protein [Vicinamibacterales bacterium]
MFRVRLAAACLAVLPLAATACSNPAADAPAAPLSLEQVAKQSLAAIDGELRVSGLKQPVEIVRDQQGIPHIFAANDDDLFFAQGYVMAQDRLWQLEMWRRWREGRLAEVFGPRAADFDARTRLLMFRGPWDAAEWTSYHPDAERLFTAWANGLNTYVAEHADNLPVEFKLTGLRPEPWTARTLTLRWAELAVDSVRGHAIAEIQLALSAKKLGVKEANRLAAPDPWDELAVPAGLDLHWFTDDLLAAARKGDGNPFEPGVLPPPAIVEPYRALLPGLQVARLMPELQDMDGSNNWVVSGRLTASGIPIVSNDPHRTIEMPSLRYFVHLNAPGWNVIGGGEPPFVGVDAGNNENMAWGFTFAGTDMVDVFVEQTNPAAPNQTKYREGWEPMTIIREEIKVKGEQAPRVVELKYSKHGPVFYEDPARHLAFAVKSVNQQPGTAAFKGSLKLAQAPSCEDFFDRAMSWKMPTHNLICGDRKGNIALQVTGLTPDRDGWNGRLPVPGTGKYEWKGFRSDLPREFNPARGYIATANDNTHPKDYKGRPVFYNVSTDVDVSRITRIRQMLDQQIAEKKPFTIEDMERMQQDAFSLRARRDAPFFTGWTSNTPEIEKARAMIAAWDHVLARDSTPAAIYVRWSTSDAGRRAAAETRAQARQPLVEQGLTQAIARATKDWGPDWSAWRYGRINESRLPHMFVDEFSLKPIERPGGFNSVNATGANFRRIMDLSDLDKTMATNAPGQSAQPTSPYYGNLREHLADGVYFPLPFSRGAVDKVAAHRLKLLPK